MAPCHALGIVQISASQAAVRKALLLPIHYLTGFGDTWARYSGELDGMGKRPHVVNDEFINATYVRPHLPNLVYFAPRCSSRSREI